MSSKANPASFKLANGLWILLLLVVVLSALFRYAWFPDWVLFSNDGPLGAIKSAFRQLPEAFTGTWADTNTLGSRDAAWPSITFALQWLLGPVYYAKFYVPIGLLILGLGAWAFFRQLGLAPIACILGALAATLNSSYFSAAAWGLAAHPITIGMSFFALAALADSTSRRRWVRVALAGLAVGMGVTEGADIGAIFSLYVAAFVLYQAWMSEGTRTRQIGAGMLRLALVAGFAAFMAAQTISVLVATQIQGVAGGNQDMRSKQERWDWATQWSLPKREALGIIIPGLFGYRMDTPQGLPDALQEAYTGGVYWGAAGRDPNWDRYFASGKQGQPPGGFLRFTGGGNYAGVLVALVAVWAVAQSLRKKNSVFSLANRRWIWFWGVVGLVSLLLAFGRHAPFYQFLYLLPYFSTIRNPAKFTHVFNWALVILSTYGAHGLWHNYMEPVSSAATGAKEGLKEWWQRVRGFDRRWTTFSALAVVASALGWLIYLSSEDAIVKYLQEVQFDPTMAKAIAEFSIRQVGWFVGFLGIAVGLVVLTLSGTFLGERAKWGGLLMILFLVVDLGRANQPWIIAWNYKQKYATNPILEKLRDKPYQQRVAILPGWIGDVLRASPELGLIDQLYRIEWAQHHFPYYDIQSLDIVQMPRMPEDLMAFETALQPKTMADVSRLVTRRWELTNTRYLIGAADFLGFLNQQLDAGRERFRIVERFQIIPKPGIARPTRLDELNAVTTTNGTFALFEFTGALPRAKLYSSWVVVTNDQASLQQLTSPAFDPHQTVLLAEPVPTSAPTATSTNLSPGSVSFTSYSPKHIVLETDAKLPSVLLLNDRYEPNWKVFVDGKPEKLLRSNYIMRSVFLPSGSHKVEFRFQPPFGTLYISLAAIGTAIALIGYLLIGGTRGSKDVETTPTFKRQPGGNG